MSEARDFYGEKFVLGEIVYFVDGDRGPGDTLAAKRGSIDQLFGRELPVVLVHDEPYDKNTVRRGGQLISMEPNDLFRSDEVAAAAPINPEDDERTRRLLVDGWLADPILNSEVTAAIQALAVDRAAALLADVSAVAMYGLLRESPPRQ